MRRVESRGLLLFKKSTFEIDDKNQPPFLFPFVSTFITYDYQAFKRNVKIKFNLKVTKLEILIAILYQPFILRIKINKVPRFSMSTINSNTSKYYNNWVKTLENVRFTDFHFNYIREYYLS